MKIGPIKTKVYMLFHRLLTVSLRRLKMIVLIIQTNFENVMSLKAHMFPLKWLSLW